MLRTKRTTMVGGLVAALFLVLAPVQTGLAQTKPLPDAWFFPDRPAGLKGMEGKPLPELKFKSWIGDQVRLSETKGKVVVIDFWATWCGPCMAAIPENVELVKKYKDQGLVFMGVHDSNSGWDKAQGVVNEKGINYPIALDADGGLSAKAINLGFWPTYLVIDREGVVRGAGMIPGHVGDAVKMLLAESAPNMPAAITKGEFPAEWYYGGNSRAASMKANEGKAMPAIAAAKWNTQPLTAADTKDRVVVLHFLASGNPASLRQGEALAALEKEMGPQGVVVVGIAPADDSWESLTKLAHEGKLPSRLCQDTLVKEDSPPKDQKKLTTLGATGSAFGVRYVPATIIVDRMGKVRATGVKTDKVKDIASKLLAENTSKPAAGASPEPGK